MDSHSIRGNEELIASIFPAFQLDPVHLRSTITSTAFLIKSHLMRVDFRLGEVVGEA